MSSTSRSAYNEESKIFLPRILPNIRKNLISKYVQRMSLKIVKVI